MKYAITGITGMRNRGVEALVVTTIEQIRLRDPQAEFTVLTRDPPYDAHRCRIAGVHFMEDSLFSRRGRGVRGLLKHLLRRRGEAWHRLVNALRESDIVIASGGDMFTSDYGPESLRRSLAPLRLAMELGRRVVFLGHSIGPFKTSEDLASWGAVAARSKLITLREGLSFDYVQASGAAKGVRVVKAADAAFLLEPAKSGDDSFAAFGLDPQRPVAACAVSQGISRYSSLDAAGHRQTWQRCIEHLTTQAGVQVLLIPHVQETNPGNDDSILATELLREISPAAKLHTRLAAGDFSAAEYKAIIGRCDLVLAERMHAAIAGLSSGVSTVVVGYSVKARGILTDILGPQIAEDGLLLPVESFADASVVTRSIERTLANRQAIAEKLGRERSRVEAAARSNFDLLHELG